MDGMDFLKQQEDSRFVVRHTFIEVVGSPESGDFRRVRASSDSDLYGKSESKDGKKWSDMEEENAEVAFELCGLSDAETMSLDGEQMANEARLQCYSHVPSESGSTDPGSSASSAVTPSHERAERQGPWADVKPAEAAQPAAFAASAPSQVDLELLLSQNAMLQMENQLLRESAGNTYNMQPEMGGQCPWFFPMGFMAVPPAMGVWDHTSAPTMCMGMPRQVPRRPQAGRRHAARGADAAPASGSGSRCNAAAATSGALGGPISCESLNEDDTRTTVMLRNLPNNYTREMLLALLDEEGFSGLYDFLYLPIDFKSRACLGYAFVNLVDKAAVAQLWQALDGFSSWILPSRKVCHVSWSGPHQGLEAHIERYRNSPIMHASVPDECKPVVFQAGARVEFPRPTKTMRAPRLRNVPARPGVAEGQGQACRY